MTELRGKIISFAPVGQRPGGLQFFCTACAWGSAGRLPIPLLRAGRMHSLELLRRWFFGLNAQCCVRL